MTPLQGEDFAARDEICRGHGITPTMLALLEAAAAQLAYCTSGGLWRCDGREVQIPVSQLIASGHAAPTAPDGDGFRYLDPTARGRALLAALPDPTRKD